MNKIIKVMAIILTVLLFFTFNSKEVFAMADTSVNDIGITTATGQITGLGNPFNTTFYMSAGIASSSVSFGQSSAPSGIKGSVSAPSSGSSTSTPSFSLTGLSAGTSQTLYGYARAGNGLYYPAGSQTVITFPNPPSGLTTTSTTPTSISVSWSNGGTYDSIQASIFKSGYYQAYPLGGSATSYTFTGLTANTSYTVVVGGTRNARTSVSPSLSTGTSSYPALATPTLNSGGVVITSSTIRVAVNSVPNAQIYYFSSPQISGGAMFSTSNTYYEFIGLASNTTYTFYVQADASGYSPSSVATFYLTTAVHNPRPAQWTSFNYISTGVSMSTYNDNLSPVTATLWNQFTAHINAMRLYKGVSSYGFTTVSQGQTVMASHMNEARIAILAMSPPTALPPVFTTTTAIGVNIKQLQTSINSIN